ncbi:fibronectin type III domain-containing protein [Paenibacillus sp. YIM B09110]|uniref:fibronectin type III domain-containing protein n=1 Tax=Paenibacillus sp. YIM B09110 TaxID=3126102 RepID=UPI00301E4935
MRKGNWLRLGLAAAIIANLLTSAVPHASADELRTTLDISKGSITIGDGTVTGKTTSGGTAAYNENGYIITGASSANVVTIKGGVEQHVTLENASITKSDSAYSSIPTVSIEGNGTKAYLTLSGANTISAYNGATQKAAISVPEGTELIIDSIDGSDTHSLTASSHSSAAAIGGNISETAGSITINSGTITAGFRVTNSGAAAIGGGKGGAGGNIVINGGVITASSFNGTAAAIGGGDVYSTYPGKTTRVTINGGTVTAKVPTNAASYFYDAIGSGYASTANRADNVLKTTVIVNGGQLFTNGIPLLYGRQAVNKDGQTVYATAIKVDVSTVPANGTAVTVHYGDHTLDTSILSIGTVYLFLPSGKIPVDITLKPSGKTYYGQVTTTTSTSTYPNSNATVSRELSTLPVISVQADVEEDSHFYYGTPITLSVTNLDSVVNKSGYPLAYGTDYTVEWYKGAGSNPAVIAGNADDPSQLTITASSGDLYRAKFIAITSGASKLEAGNTGNLSSSLTADWLKRTVSFTNLQETYSFGEEAVITAALSEGNDSITFSSSDESVISLDAATGELTAHKLGFAMLTAVVEPNTTAKQSPAVASQLVEVVPLHPLAPVQVSAVAGDGEAEVSFNVSDNPDGSINTDYKVTAWTGGESVKTANGASSPIIVTGLDNGTAYTFTVVATNATGDSPASEPSEEVTPETPASAPDKPTGVTATAGDGEAEVSFTEPASNGSNISEYTVTAWSGGEAVKTATGSTSPITVTGLENGTAYTFTVVATNGVGNSSASDPSEEITPTAPETPASAPDKPTGVTVTAGDGEAEVSFTEPASNGSNISIYTVTAWSGGEAVKTATGSSSPITVTGLANGTPYTFTVVATNGVGNSSASDPSEEITPTAAETPASAPAKPTNVTATAGDGEAEVSFTEPSSNGSNISEYTVTAWSGGEAVKTATGSSSPITVTGLANGTAYTFTIVATNGVGNSLASNPSGEITPTAAETPASAPAKPTNVTATAGNREAMVRFTAPSGNGSDISLYTVTAWSGGEAVKTATGIASPIKVTGLVNRIAYTFTVVASNGVGDSLPSDSSASVVPTSGGSSTPVTPVEPTIEPTVEPTATPTTAETAIPANEAGEVKLNEEVWVSIPSETSDQPIQIKVEKLPGSANLIEDTQKLASPIFELLKNFTENFKNPVTLRFAFDQKILQDESLTVSVFYYDETEKRWIEIGGEVNNGFITVQVDHFTKFAVFAVNKEIPKPLAEFSDIAGHWAELEIKRAVGQSLITGYPEGTFKPNQTITRAEFIVILAKALNWKNEGVDLSFTDKESIGSWAEKAVAQAVEAKVISGYNDDSFRPNAEITRAEIAVLISRAFGFARTESAAEGSFADANDIPSWSREAVEAVRERGIVSGRGGNLFAPNDQATRAEAVAILLKALGNQ